MLNRYECVFVDEGRVCLRFVWVIIAGAARTVCIKQACLEERPV